MIHIVLFALHSASHRYIKARLILFVVKNYIFVSSSDGSEIAKNALYHPLPIVGNQLQPKGVGRFHLDFTNECYASASV